MHVKFSIDQVGDHPYPCISFLSNKITMAAVFSHCFTAPPYRFFPIYQPRLQNGPQII